MAKKNTEINYPTQEWIDAWVDKWLDANPTVKVDDFKVIEEKAMDEWWDKEIDANRPTPFDLTDEQKKNAKKMTITTSGEKKQPMVAKFEKKERKKDETKVGFIEKLAVFLKTFVENVEIVKPEKEISFTFGGESYSLSLTKHRKPKE